MQYIVYLYSFNINTFPNKYIGSKTKCSVKDGTIINERGIPYYGSSSRKEYHELLAVSRPTLTILDNSSTNSKELLEKEIYYLKKYNVDTNPEFFNMFIPPNNNFCWDDYATYKHIEYGTYKRLPKTHPLVRNKTYVGTTYGLSIKKQHPINLSGKNNPFYGKSHSEKSKQKMSASIKAFYKTESGQKMRKCIALRAHNTFAGRSKSKEHRKKIGRKGLIILKNIHTNECVRIPRAEGNRYDPNIWMTPTKFQKKIKCKYCDMVSVVGNIERWHNENCKHKPLENKMKIKSIKKVGKRAVYDLSVKDAEHYILDNGVISHNTGGIYNSDSIFVITRAQEKDSKKNLEGYRFTINVQKSRFVREGAKLPFTVNFDKGIDKWSGLLDIAVETGHVTKPKQGWFTRPTVKDDKQWRRAETSCKEFWLPILTETDFAHVVEQSLALGGDGEVKLIPEDDNE